MSPRTFLIHKNSGVAVLRGGSCNVNVQMARYLKLIIATPSRQNSQLLCFERKASCYLLNLVLLLDLTYACVKEQRTLFCHNIHMEV